MIRFTLNNRRRTVDTSEETPLLWLLRDQLGLHGTRYGCGLGVCGTCTVHLDGRAVRSCTTPSGEVNGRSVTTIEGLARDDELDPVQQAWIDEEVAQCGFCQAGQIMAAAALLRANPDPSDAEIDQAMRDIICRCGTYERIRRAIRLVASSRRSG